MAQYYIKDVIKSMLKMDKKVENNQPEENECDTVLSKNLINQLSDDEIDKTKSIEDTPISPNGPVRNSIKEIEEQLSALRKENFNLKLRIYFLEEGMGTHFNMDQEGAIKKNIELMVELESLRKELEEKQNLLCQAVKAIELEEEEHRKDTDSRDKELREIKQQYEVLQQQYDVMQEEARSQGDHVSVDSHKDLLTRGFNIQDDNQAVRELENKVLDLDNQLRCEKATTERLNSMLKYAENNQSSNSDLQGLLSEKEERIDDLMMELEEKNQILSEAHMKLDAMEIELQEKKSELNFLDSEVSQRNTEMNELQAENHSLSIQYEDVKAAYEHEMKKTDKSKVAISNRNSKIAELEASLDKAKVKIATLEVKLESAINEVKMRGSSSLADDTSKSLLKSYTSSPSKSPNSSREAKKNLTLEELKEELKKVTAHGKKLEIDNNKACRIIKSMLEKSREHAKEIEVLRSSIKERDDQINNLAKQLNDVKVHDKKSLKTRISEMNLTAAAPASDAEHNPEEDKENENLLEQYKSLTKNLEEDKKILQNTLKEKDTQMDELYQKYSELLQDLKTKSARITDLEFEVINNRPDLSGNREKSDVGNEKVSFWVKESEDKDREIERLEKELKKRTNDLQNVVNNELWEKNREIEKLQRRYAAALASKDLMIVEAHRNIASQEEHLRSLKAKITEFKSKHNEHSFTDDRKILREQLNFCIEERKKLINEIAELKENAKLENGKIIELSEQLQQSEKLRLQTNEVCLTLSGRLEELAVFLDSLLRQKSVLGFLANKHCVKLRQVVEQSLDLSRSLSLSINMNPDQSLLQLSNITELLNSTKNESLTVEEFFGNKEGHRSSLSVMPESATLTYQSHLHIKCGDKTQEQAQIIQVLRSQVEDLKREIELRDNELANKVTVKNDHELIDTILDMNPNSQKTMSPEDIIETLKSDGFKLKAVEKSTSLNTTKYDDNSESESYSEPDRLVSKARIGLNDETLVPKQKSVFMQSESTELELSKSLNRTPSKKNSFSENKQVINKLMQQVYELENKLREKDQQLADYKSVSNQLDNKVKELLGNIKEKDIQLTSSKNAYQEIDNKFRETNDIKDDLLKKIGIMEEKLFEAEAKRNAAEKQINELLKNVEDLKLSKTHMVHHVDSKTRAVQDQINQLECDKDRALEAADSAQKRLIAAEEEIRSTECKLRKLHEQAQSELNSRVQRIEKEYAQKVKTIETKTEEQILLITESANSMKAKYDAEYVKRADVEHLLQAIQEVESLKDVLKVSEEKISTLKQSEASLKTMLESAECEHREKVVELHGQLDTINLQLSEAILHKAKVEEENMRLQSDLRKFSQRESEFVQQVFDLKQDLAAIKETRQKQLAVLEKKNAELENRNCDLRKKLLRLRDGREEGSPFSAPNSPNSKILDLYFSKPPDFAVRDGRNLKSGDFINADQVVFNNSVNVNMKQDDDNERLHANSSPDLGIESDHGRFSSLEANVPVPRPFLHPIEVTRSINNLLEEYVPCVNKDCEQRFKLLQDRLQSLNLEKIKSENIVKSTLEHICKANMRKKQVEKHICKQLQKTTSVLEKAYSNLDSGSDTEFKKK